MGYWLGYIVATITGLLIGIERERANPKSKSMGLRTFLLITLLGAIAGDLKISWLSALLALFSLSLIVIAYYKQFSNTTPKPDHGLTTEFAAAITFCLGYISHQQPVLVAILGPIVALLLLSKKVLHKFTHAIKTEELESALLLFLCGSIVFNLVPNKTVDPWNIFNPRDFSMLILILALLEFFSYVTIKIFGSRKGAIFSGIFGGLVSSTAVVLSAAKNTKANPQLLRTQLVVAMTAILSSIIEVVFLVLLVASDLLLTIGWGVAAGITVGAIALYILHAKSNSKEFGLTIKSPLDWLGVFRLAILLAFILLIISVTKNWFGESAGLMISFLTGLFEVHGVSLANATLYSQKQFSADKASLGIIFATISSLLAKCVLAWVVERGKFARALTSIIVPMIIAISLFSWMLI